MDKLKMHTPDLTTENFRKLAALFPNAVTETINEDGEIVRAIDADVLRQEISAEVVEGQQERYQFTWPDKKKSVVLANAPVAKTLRLDRSKSVGRDGTPGSIDTENIYIEGDNLDALKLLQETYLGKVKMIYIDPPYNTGSDFIYEDNFSRKAGEYLPGNGQFDEEGNRLVQNTEKNGRFHTDWLNMLYPRLRIAKDLLANDGVIFISIDDNELENMLKCCNEVFGAGNFVANLIWKSKSGGANDSKFFAVDHEYILVFAKSIDKFTLYVDTEATVTTSYSRKDEKGEYALDRLDKQSIRYSPALDYEIIGPDGTIYAPKHKDPLHPNASWRWSKKKVKEHYEDLVFENGCVYTKNYKKTGAIARSLLLEDRFGRTRTGKTDCFALFNRDYFQNPKPYKLIRFLQMIAADKNSIILDFFSGSATTAHAVMQLNAEDGGNRKFIMVQLPEVADKKSEAHKAGYKTICDIGEERIRRAGKKILQEVTSGKGNIHGQGYGMGIDNLKKYEQQTGERILDIGFRVFRVDSSNMEDVYYRPAEYNQEQMEQFSDNIKPDRTPEDLLFQVMLDLGILLSSTIEETEIAGKKVFSVAGGYLLACFDKDVTEDTVTEIAKRHPFYAVFRDSSMANDSVATNFEQIFATYSPKTVRRVL